MKPCVTSRVLVDSESYMGAMYRTFKGENRNNIISKVEQVFNQTVDAIEAHKNTDHIKIIINYAAVARNGVASLMDTYASDPDFKSRLKVQIDNIDLQLDRFRNMIRGYGYELDLKDEDPDDFPGLNTIDLMDSSSELDKRKIRKNRIKKSLEKDKDM